MSKLVSLSITLASEGVLLCAALWMKVSESCAFLRLYCTPHLAPPPSPPPSLITQACPLLGLTLAKSLCYEFCVLLPDALDPLLGLADHSPLLAYHMAATFTTLYPLHVGTLGHEATPTSKCPNVCFITWPQL